MAAFKTVAGKDSAGNAGVYHVYGKRRVFVRSKAAPVADPMGAQVAADTKLQYGASDQALADQRAQNAQVSANIPSWYADYKNALSMATQRTQQAYGAALGVQQNVMASSSALDEQQRAALQQGQATDAAARGATVDPSLAQKSQQAAASRQSTLAAQQGLTAGLGAAQVGYRAGQQVVGAAQEIGAQTAQRNVGLNLDAKQRDLAAQKGAFAVSDKAKLTDAARQTELENQAFGLKVQTAAASDSNAKANIALRSKSVANTANNQAANLKIRQAELDISKQRADAYIAKQSKTGKPLSASSKAASGKARNDISYALSHIPKMLEHTTPKKVPATDKNGKVIPNKFVVQLDKNGNPVPGKKATIADVRAALENGEGPFKSIPHDAVNAALKLLDKQKGGYLSAAQISGLRAAYPGVSIGALGFQTEHGRARTAAHKKTISVKAKARLKATGAPKADTGNILG